jgi:hypothetical protein
LEQRVADLERRFSELAANGRPQEAYMTGRELVEFMREHGEAAHLRGGYEVAGAGS